MCHGFKTVAGKFTSCAPYGVSNNMINSNINRWHYLHKHEHITDQGIMHPARKVTEMLLRIPWNQKFKAQSSCSHCFDLKSLIINL